MAQAHAYVEVVQRGSFTDAARALGVSKGTVSRQVTALERALGVRLLQRTSRAVSATDEGALFYERARLAVEAWARAIEGALERHQEPVGSLRITASGGIGARWLAPVVCEYLQTYPKVSVDLVLDDRIRDLVGEGFDLAVRTGPLQDSSLHSVKLAEDHELVVGSPSLCDRFDGSKPEELKSAPWIHHTALSIGTVRSLSNDQGQSVSVQVGPRVRCSTSDGIIALALGGAGLLLAPSVMLQAELKSGALRQLQPKWRGRRFGIHAIYPSREYMPLRVERLIAALREAAPELGA